MDRRIGFASLSPAQLIAVSRKGGSVKAKKGFAVLTPEQRVENARKGALAMHKKRKEQHGKEIQIESSVSEK